MGEVIDALGPAAPFGAAVLLLAFVGRWISTEVRHHRQQGHNQKLEREIHELRKQVLEAQLGQASAQQVAQRNLSEQVESAEAQLVNPSTLGESGGLVESPAEGGSLGEDEADQRALLRQLVWENKQLDNLQVQNDSLAHRLERAMAEGAPHENLEQLTQELIESRRALSEAQDRVTRLVKKTRGE